MAAGFFAGAFFASGFFAGAFFAGAFFFGLPSNAAQVASSTIPVGSNLLSFWNWTTAWRTGRLNCPLLDRPASYPFSLSLSLSSMTATRFARLFSGLALSFLSPIRRDARQHLPLSVLIASPRKRLRHRLEPSCRTLP